jgi:hypothetical protein
MTNRPKSAALPRDSGPPSPRQREGREHAAPAIATESPTTTASFSQPTSRDNTVPQQDWRWTR